MLKVVRNAIVIFLLLAITMTAYIAINAFSSTPLVTAKSAHPEQVSSAVNQYRRISYQIFGSSSNVRLLISHKGIDDVMVAASHLLPRASFSNEFNGREATVNGTLDVHNPLFDGYLNVSCHIISGRENGSIKSCKVGSISIPGMVVQQLINISLSLFFDDSVKNTINQLINEVQIRNNVVFLSATKDPDFKTRIKNGLKNVASAVKSVSEPEIYIYEPELINLYLEHIIDSDWPEADRHVSLSFVLSQAFELAKARSQHNDPRTENEAAIWAVAIAFANRRFAEIIKVDTPAVKQTLKRVPQKIITLGNRPDLSLHFLYSAIIERVGNSTLSVQVGELKELYDANPNGSGFDFSDLLADKSGAQFSRYLSSSIKAAIDGQNKLAANPGESLFFPPISELPKPVRGREFDDTIGSTSTERYQKQIAILEQRISHLPLYSNDPDNQ